ncbi:hypothetical protein PMI01_01610 [Caulobacter sp. AP07]|uniref:hypothetical protein n=1 Tax=Caulobacter sp. AP07 TaxID=1144304 RepID=UPI0002722007|nr:hypothetical protein [Caulobacter sp. AP07]EJL34553.1 hypothetical protein PMI01_01610 [Caulobacter sp. AP07]
MTQADIPTWCFTFQQKLMAALDAAWAILENSHDLAQIRAARDRAKACGELAAVARKIALIVPAARAKVSPPSMLDAAAAALHATQAVGDLGTAIRAPRALDKLKGGRRGRL